MNQFRLVGERVCLSSFIEIISLNVIVPIMTITIRRHRRIRRDKICKHNREDCTLPNKQDNNFHLWYLRFSFILIG